jgi:hypothetical protein
LNSLPFHFALAREPLVEKNLIDESNPAETVAASRNAGNKKARKAILPGRNHGGDKGDRTPDLKIANLALSQLSYIPKSAADAYYTLSRPHNATVFLK